ncbi:DNA internalization-related competence protein ComEC/Rec2 [Microbulbifer variabilis]|uniref:DNA internalization-related competence protein ComEC/Rec2 n=1 Tax=Microbulbifer variabilis TaxID=266805 RepID=UPI00036E959D|nr:DNA internalization-related competence protein ComEC/Rec2 [Microbulbifer variabilis]
MGRRLTGSPVAKGERRAGGSRVPILGGPIVWLWVFSLSIVLVGLLPVLPRPTELLGGYLVVSLVVAPSSQRISLWGILLVSFAGSSWALFSNQAVLDQRLPLWAHGSDHFLDIEVTSLPEIRSVDGGSWQRDPGVNIRFQAKVVSTNEDIVSGSLLYLTWYRVTPSALVQLRGNSHWRLPVRLKRPRGSVNPYGFDYEGWLLRRGVYATGYVRPKDLNPEWLGQGWGLAKIRDVFREALRELPIERPALAAALLLGDRSGLSGEEREILQRTGTAHLLAISGLHVGMVAGFLLLIGNMISRSAGVFIGASLRLLPVILASSGVLVYTLLAGAPLSAQRAMVMTWVLLLAWQWRRRIGAGFAFALALTLVLVIQPLAFYEAGFWLSFAAVAALLLGFGGRQVIGKGHQDQGREGGWRSLPRVADTLNAFLQLLRSQWLVALGLILPSVVYFSGYSSGGLLLNLLAIPWLGLLILPALMLGALLINTALGHLFLSFAGWQLDLLLQLLERADRYLPTWQALSPPQGVLMLSVVAGCLLMLLMPRGMPGRNLGWLFLLPLIQPVLPLPATEREGLTFAVLDVGQGLALVLYSSRGKLVVDAGPVSNSGWSAGNTIVAPFLSGRGIDQLDALIVSHGDQDHAGGVEGVLSGKSVSNLYAPGKLGQKLAAGLDVFSKTCVAGKEEKFGDINIRWLWPEQVTVTGEENDHSCVALVEWGEVRILLTGDISAAVERRLLMTYPQFVPVDVLVAPHHGSKTSSSMALLNWAKPRHVVFSAGFRHHFGHPHSEVVARYHEVGARIFNTADSGAVEFFWGENALEPEIFIARSAPRFWYASHTDSEGLPGRLSRRE